MNEHVAITLQPSGGEKETVKAGGFDVADKERPFAQNHGTGCRAHLRLGPARALGLRHQHRAIRQPAFVLLRGLRRALARRPLPPHAHRPRGRGGGRARDAGVEAEVKGALSLFALPANFVYPPITSDNYWVMFFLLIHEAQQGCRDATYEPSRFPVAVPYPSPHRATPAYVVVTSSDLDTSRNKASVSGLSWISRMFFARISIALILALFFGK